MAKQKKTQKPKKRTLIEKYNLMNYITLIVQGQSKREKQEKENLENYLQTIDGSLDLGIESVAKKKVSATRLHLVYPAIDPSFLNMRNKSTYTGKYGGFCFACNFDLSLPHFAVYSLDSPYCKIEVELAHKKKEYRDSKLWITSFEMSNPELPSQLENSLRKAIRLEDWENVWNDRNICKTWEFTSVFTGIIPKETKKRIKSVQKIFGRDIYIIAEAENWEGEEVPNTDPLVVGVIDDKCFLLDEFDCTPMEEYVRREFNISGGRK